MNNLFDKNEQIDVSHFEWFLPSPPRPVLALTVYSGGEICFNGKLCEYVPKQLRIGVNRDGKILGLAGCSEKGYRVPKNGRIKDPNLVKVIEKRGIVLPAKYIVENKNDIWIATIITPTPLTTVGKTPKKPRQNSLKSMLPKKK